MKSLEPRPGEFYTQSDYEELRADRLKGPDGWLLFMATESGYPRAQRVVDLYNQRLRGTTDAGKQVLLIHEQGAGVPIIKRFTDGETNPRLPVHVSGANVFLFTDPHSRVSGLEVNDEVFRAMQLACALKTNGVQTVNLVIPYLPYSRGERASYLRREVSQAQLFIALLRESGVDSILSYHLHNDAIKSFFQPNRLIGISGLNLFKDIFKPLVGTPAEAVTVCTDAGGAKANHYLARDLGISEAICNKVRSTRVERTESLGMIGDFAGKRVAFFSDDETVTFGSFLNAIRAVAPKVQEMYAAVSHFKLAEEHLPRLDEARALGLRKLYVTDSVPQVESVLAHPLVEVKSLDTLFVALINRLHYKVSVGSMFKA